MKIYASNREGRNRVMVEMPDGKFVVAWTDGLGRTKSVDMPIRPNGQWQLIHELDD